MTNLITRFKELLYELEQDYWDRGLSLKMAIAAWCDKLSINETSSSSIAYEDIQQYINEWLGDSLVRESGKEIYLIIIKIAYRDLDGFRVISSIEKFFSLNINNFILNRFNQNIHKTKKEMSNSNKLILITAFVLTGVGILLFLLNRKEKTRESRYLNSPANSPSLPASGIKEKYILALLINSDRNQELINSLKENNYLKQEDCRQLYDATQGLWIGKEIEFNNSVVKREFNSQVSLEDEYDCHFVKIELDENDTRFNKNANPMDRRDAFIALANKSPQVTVSPRLSSQAYENTEFYNR